MSKNRCKKLAKEFAKMPCHICGGHSQNSGHHIMSVGAYPELGKWRGNLVALCFGHHREVEDIGTNCFVDKYHLEGFMHDRGFEQRSDGRWYAPDDLIREVRDE
jgi:hypothetical protein